MKIEYIALDFDGTVVTHEFPEIGIPIQKTIDWVKHYQNLGSKILLWTCREDYPERQFLTEAVEYCRSVGINLYGINENPDIDFGKRKIVADIYVDDKALNVCDIEEGIDY